MVEAGAEPTIVLVPRETARAGPIVAVLMLALAIAGSFLLARFVPALITADLGMKAAAAIAACYLASRIDASVYERYATRGRLRRLLVGVAFPVIAAVVGAAAGVGCLRLAPALAERGTLGLTFFVGALWLTGASLGSLVVLARESPRASLNARFVRALIGVAILTALGAGIAVRFGPKLIELLLQRAPNLFEVWTPMRTLLYLPAGPHGVWLGVILLLVALPAALSAAGHLLDAALERVSALQAASDAVSEGDLDVRVDEGGNRELARLGRSYNDMLDSLSRMRRLEKVFGPNSRVVLDRLRARAPSGELAPEGRVVTVIAIEVRDLSTIIEWATPQQVVDLMGRLYEKVVTTVDKYEGWFERFSAEGIVAVFNAPLEQTDHMLRGTRSAIEIQTELVTLKRNDAGGIGRLGISIGVASSLVSMGTYGGRYLVAGEAFELAIRLAALTPSGQVWVNQRNAETLPMYIPSQMLGAVNVKGHLVAPYRVWPPP